MIKALGSCDFGFTLQEIELLEIESLDVRPTYLLTYSMEQGPS
jgi:hypothetical protein